ncbi:aminoglycoside phosphotransferase family protein [Microbacterium cremeum]|uniref:aminoglycoside phosphotransferase family protein n=1 Tax=Microbacterium cremeum TaxID=2782169 RepID=UPI0018875218|nr:aminoglycoside phosphotransferase family protein [Microbacterium cremeum]
MPDKPAAEIAIDAALVRSLVASQASHAIPAAETLPLEKVAEGWDSEVWRLGDHAAVRLPRRALAAPLVLHEQRALPGIAQRLSATGVRVPDPIVAGRPTAGYPWAWSVVPWIDGTRGLDVPRRSRAGWAATLAGALQALHVEAPADHPVNPVRGRPLETRDAVFHERLEGLRRAATLDEHAADDLRRIWQAGVTAPAWSRRPVWIHGDLHPGNLVAQSGRLRGIIDFGDVTAGDPAYDLAVVWLAFDGRGREAFRASTSQAYDADTWQRAHAWAAAVVVMLLTHSDDAPDYAALARDAIPEILGTAR